MRFCPFISGNSVWYGITPWTSWLFLLAQFRWHLKISLLIYTIPALQLATDIRGEVNSQNLMLDNMVRSSFRDWTFWEYLHKYWDTFWSCNTASCLLCLCRFNFLWMLDVQGKSFGTAGDLFKNTIGKLGSMLTSGSSYHMYYLVAFVVFVFLILYFLMGR